MMKVRTIKKRYILNKSQILNILEQDILSLFKGQDLDIQFQNPSKLQ